MILSIFAALSASLSTVAGQLQTPSPTVDGPAFLTSTRASTITPVVSLSCTGGSTVLTTTECTYGHIISYCYSKPATIVCSDGYYPSVYNPVRCVVASTCFPLPTTTTTCNVGFTAQSTYTAFNGVLNNGSSTIIEFPQCACSGHVAWSTAPYASYCLPTGTCAPYLTATTSSYSFANGTSTVTRSFTQCNCPASQTRKSSLKPFRPVLIITAVYKNNTLVTCASKRMSSTIPTASASATSTISVSQLSE